MTIRYELGDALAALDAEPNRSASFIHLDDAWARPGRNGAFGVNYSTHPFDESEADAVADEPGVETDLTVVDMLNACRETLVSGGVLAVDTDSYLLPEVCTYLCSEWSPRCFAVAHVTALTADGQPDRSTPGMYGSSGGYATVLAWRDACPAPIDHPLHTYHDLHCSCRRQREDYGWGTVKPLAPLLKWVRNYTDAGDRILVPCAGTAPAAIAAERLHGDQANVLCVDVEPEAKAAYERRRADELEHQTALDRFG